MSTVTAKLVVRFSGMDTDVCVRADDENAWTLESIAYSPSDTAKELVAVDGWTSQPFDETSLNVDSFVEKALDCLDERPANGPKLSVKWKTAAASLAVPGHVYLNGRWVIEPSAAAPAGTFTTCLVPLMKANETEVYFESAAVGALMIRVDYWISLSIA